MSQYVRNEAHAVEGYITRLLFATRTVIGMASYWQLRDCTVMHDECIPHAAARPHWHKRLRRFFVTSLIQDEEDQTHYVWACSIAFCSPDFSRLSRPRIHVHGDHHGHSTSSVVYPSFGLLLFLLWHLFPFLISVNPPRSFW